MVKLLTHELQQKSTNHVARFSLSLSSTTFGIRLAVIFKQLIKFFICHHFLPTLQTCCCQFLVQTCNISYKTSKLVHQFSVILQEWLQKCHLWYFQTTLCSKKSDAKIQITITTAYLIRIKCLLSGFNYHISDVNVANFNKIHRRVSEQQLFEKWNSKTEVSNMEKSH